MYIGTVSGIGFNDEQGGVFEIFFEHLASLSTWADLVQMFESNVVRAHISAQAQKGAIWPSAWPLTRRLLDQNPPEDRL